MLGSDEYLMVIARASLEGWVALHGPSEPVRRRARRWQGLPEGSLPATGVLAGSASGPPCTASPQRPILVSAATCWSPTAHSAKRVWRGALNWHDRDGYEQLGVQRPSGLGSGSPFYCPLRTRTP